MGMNDPRSGLGAKPMLPHGQLSDFLGLEEQRRLLDWTLANRDSFRPALLEGRRLEPTLRRAETLRELGPMRPLLERRFIAALPELFKLAGARPFPAPFLELELAAHGDGAHFTAHRDIPTGPDRAPLGGDESGTQDRVVSVVYYFHKEPKAFTGGQLRLHRIGSDAEAGDYVDLEPRQDSLVAFPSWTSHEVLPVRCESEVFEDYRFAVNCWLCRQLGQG
jgi:SM-20-related protein